MKNAIDRRTFIKVSAMGLAAAMPPIRWLKGSSQKLKIGHTGITWGYGPQNAPQAVKDVGSLGYYGFESFGNVLEFWEKKGGLYDVFKKNNITLRSAFCTVNMTDPSKRKDEIDKLVRWGKLIKNYRGKIAVIGPNPVNRKAYDFIHHKTDIVETLNEVCKALKGIGIIGTLHQHFGTCIQSHKELYTVMDNVDTDYVKLCPDSGHLFNGGLDPVQVVKDFLPLIRHAHLKDYSGGKYYNGFCPLGQGKVNVKGVLEVLETSDHDFMVMAEVNPPRSNSALYPPLEVARMNKAYLSKLGYKFRS